LPSVSGWFRHDRPWHGRPASNCLGASFLSYVQAWRSGGVPSPRSCAHHRATWGGVGGGGVFFFGVGFCLGGGGGGGVFLVLGGVRCARCLPRHSRLRNDHARGRLALSLCPAPCSRRAVCGCGSATSRARLRRGRGCGSSVADRVGRHPRTLVFAARRQCWACFLFRAGGSFAACAVWCRLWSAGVRRARDRARGVLRGSLLGLGIVSASLCSVTWVRTSVERRRRSRCHVTYSRNRSARCLAEARTVLGPQPVVLGVSRFRRLRLLGGGDRARRCQSTPAVMRNRGLRNATS